MREYELWLDESGNFQPEDQRNRELEPSLVGGILIEKGILSEAEITEMTSAAGTEGFAHATDYEGNESITVVLPALKRICEKGGKLVYFENKERISTLNHRELYLRLTARGLVQLFQQIAKDGDYLLDIYLARRIDVEKNGETIPDAEYFNKLDLYIKNDKEDGIVNLGDRTVINIVTLSARQERRLQLADFACNSRLTRNSDKFDGVHQELYSLYDNDYIFHFKVETSEQRVQAMLAAGDVSMALLELYTGYGDMDHDSVFADIMDRFSRMSYRLKRLHLNRFASDVVAYVRTENEFERGEAIVKGILSEVFPVIQERGDTIQTDEAMFQLNAWLFDMYIREGDVLQAGDVLNSMEGIIRKMNYRVENLRHLYLYNDRKALYEIACMDYEKGIETIDKSINVLKNLLEAVIIDDTMLEYLGNEEDMRSEMLGNAYCMRVYAEMFMQRGDKELYSSSLRKDTELALEQYQYEGELERNQQYRAHVEMIQGNYVEALRWLLSTEQIEYDPKKIRECCIAYLDGALDEDYLSRAYYLMYYIELMLEADTGNENNLAGEMKGALDVQERIKDEFLVRGAFETDIRSDRHSSPRIHKDIFRQILKHSCGLYHPLEIIHWKYALYLSRSSGRGSKAVLDHFKWAQDICRPKKEGEDYLVMRIVSLAISLDTLACMSEKQYKLSEYKAELNALEKRIKDIIKIKDAPPKMMDYASEVKGFSEKLEVGRLMTKPQIRQAEALAHKVAF